MYVVNVVKFYFCCRPQPYSRIQSQYNPYGLSGLEYTTPEWQRQNYPLVPRVRVSHNYTIQCNQGRSWKWQTWSSLRKDVYNVYENFNTELEVKMSWHPGVILIHNQAMVHMAQYSSWSFQWPIFSYFLLSFRVLFLPADPLHTQQAKDQQ